MKSVVLSLFFLSLLTSPVWAGTFSLDFNDYSTHLGFVQKLNTQTYGDSVAKIRYLYNDDSRTNLAASASRRPIPAPR